ncbi:MAG TPA: hypothetical protein VKA65_06365 [Acidimicrobiales bacterium]|nr:hypothetical protein [Acidimicrobiales bacterium]
MSDYSESGAVPVEDAAVDDPPTIDEELAERDEPPPQGPPDLAPPGG